MNSHGFTVRNAAGLTELVRKSALAAAFRRLLPERYRPIGYLTTLVRDRTADRIRRGPFAGMHYSGKSIGSAYLPKILGSYERELVPAIETACSRRPTLIINIGAAEGYYAVGLARRNPQARVVAFEQDPVGRTALDLTALLNGVSARVEIRGHCGPAELRAALRSSPGPAAAHGSTFVLCDAEGDEKVLCDPLTVPELISATLLVETHEFIHPGITQELRTRFAVTHLVQEILQQARSGAEFPFKTLLTSCFPQAYLDWAVSEWRPARMSWLWMRPHEAGKYK